MSRSLSIENRVPAVRGSAGKILPGIDWWLCLIALASLEFIQYFQTSAAYTFTAASALCAVREPGRAMEGAMRGGMIWVSSHSGWCPALVAPCPTCRSEAPIDAALVMVRALPATSVREMKRCSRNDAGAISNQGASGGNLRLVLRAAPCSAQQPCGGQHPTECPVQNMSGCSSNALGFSPRRISCDPFQRNFQIWGGYEGCFGATLTHGENC